jgi:hypothetical protein
VAGTRTGEHMTNALQALGVESHWVCYPSAFHNGRWDDASQCDYMARMLAWWNRFLRDAPAGGVWREGGCLRPHRGICFLALLLLICHVMRLRWWDALAPAIIPMGSTPLMRRNAP